MFKNYLTVALRNLKRHKLYSVINICGLAVGMACCFLILLFVMDELSYDRFHTDASRIYRVSFDGARAPFNTAEFLRDHSSDVDEIVRFSSGYSTIVLQGDQRYQEKGLFYAEPTFFIVFTFPLALGSPHTALEAPNAIVISSEVAEKFFPNEDPIGKSLQLKDRFQQDVAYTVTGVLAPIPSNSHNKVRFLRPFHQYHSTFDSVVQGEPIKRISRVYTYVKLKEGLDAEVIQSRWAQMFEKMPQIDDSFSVSEFVLQPLIDIHFYSHFQDELGTNADINDVWFWAGIGGVILLIACINYVNIAVAKSLNRVKEVGLRKVVGATRIQLIGQFISEAVLLCCLSAFVAVALAELCLPFVNVWLDKKLLFEINTASFLCLIALILITSLLASSYPAFLVSGVAPASILKGETTAFGGSALLRKSLMMFQFVFSIGFLVVTACVQSQLDFMLHSNLGFNKEQLLVIPMQNVSTTFYETMKQELLRDSRILNMTLTSGFMGSERMVQRNYEIKEHPDIGPVRWETVFVDRDFLRTLQIDLGAGMSFDRNFENENQAYSFLLNETAAQLLGGQAIGKTLKSNFFPMGNISGSIVGVVQDFHAQSFHHAITPLVISIHPDPNKISHISHMFIKLRGEDVPGAIEFIQSKWKVWTPGFEMSFSFLDDDFDTLYKSETRLYGIFSVASFLAIFLAVLGLFGLAAFTAERRTKEIGIRKVLGASVGGIVMLLSKDFVKLVLLANVIAWPVAYWTMCDWLANFAYRIDLGWEVFVLSGGLVLVITLLTVGYQAWKAARANPVDALRYE